MRLDLYLVNNFDLQSRNKASELIKSNKIKIDGTIITKPSFNVENEHQIEILEDELYVSRAAYKLKYFLDEIKLNLKDKNTLDIGSSTGGFTQILLENEVKKVTCVDVGTNQLHDKVKENPRIDFFENTDIRDFQSNEIFHMVTCDVSFISIHNIIDTIDKLASSDVIILFKPQFEVGNNVKRNKKGVVTDKKAIARARDLFINKTTQLNWKIIHSNESKLQGKDGNEEELFYFSK